jgi:hypothetical protein
MPTCDWHQHHLGSPPCSNSSTRSGQVSAVRGRISINALEGLTGCLLVDYRGDPRGAGGEPAVTARTYFIANRVWWGGALFIAPIVAAILGEPLAGVVAAAVLVLPAFIIFDTDRGWWSADVKTLPEDKDRTKSELRLLTICAACGLAVGVVIAYLVG